MRLLNQYSDTTLVKAQWEIEIMSALQDGPKTSIELANEIGVTHRRTKRLIQGLKAAGCIKRVPNSKAHFIELLPA